MRSTRLIWQILPAHLFVILGAMIAASWLVARTVRSFHYEETERKLFSAARLVSERLAVEADPLKPETADAVCDRLGKAAGYRVTVVLPRGEVVADSERDPATLDNHRDRPEIRAALVAGRGSSRRFSNTLRMNMLYVAVPFVERDRTAAMIRVSLPLARVDGAVAVLQRRILALGLLLAAVAVVLSALISRRITRPLQTARKGAEAFAAGNLDGRLPTCVISEVNVLSRTLNRMAEQLKERINTVTQQRDQQQALFACMTECVIAVDPDRRIIQVNKAAERLFEVSADDCLGRNVVEIVRNAELHEIVDRALGTDELVEGDVHLFDRGLHLQAHGTALRNPGGGRIGAVLVLNDTTRLHRLEALRRDFVANVSHELKTPVTSIRGFIETLLDGAAEKKSDRDRFLGIIDTQAARLHRLLEDLLTLASLENEAERSKIDIEEVSLRSVLNAGVSLCRAALDAKEMHVEMHCAEELKASLNAPLIEQAVSNLIDNAAKYSDAGKTIVLSADREGKEIVVRVRDEGCGIEKRHLPRLFERFYRVDKGRSRKLGGTGLGLAIVKHVATVHGGRADVRSEPGKGSTFSIYLPAA